MCICQGWPFTWLFSTDAVCLSHMGLISIPRSLSLSPCLKNSSMILSVHCRYTAKGFVGLLRSAQCTMFLKTCTNAHHVMFMQSFEYRLRHAWRSSAFNLLCPCGHLMICVFWWTLSLLLYSLFLSLLIISTTPKSSPLPIKLGSFVKFFPLFPTPHHLLLPCPLLLMIWTLFLSSPHKKVQ